MSKKELKLCQLKGSWIVVFKANLKGALTVEAALILPVLLCAFFSVIFLIRIVCTYELIQHAINETGSEIAASSYIYHISGVRDLHDTVRKGINDRSDAFEDQIGSVIDAYSTLKGIGSGGNSGKNNQGIINGIVNSAETMGDAKKSFSEVFNNSKAIMSDPADELKTIAFYIAGGAFDDIKTQLYIPIVKLYMKKYLVSDGYSDIDERLRALGVVNGFEGLDFSESSFLANRDESIDIVVRYKISLPLPIQFHKDMELVQRVKVKAWMGGDEKNGVLDGNTISKGEDVWSLNNFQRGLKIRRIFGANLPNSFPVVAKYEKGKAVMIKSMDLTAGSYQTASNIEKTLKGYVNELEEYKGQDKPWGGDNITIKGRDIVKKELLLIIPENKSENSAEMVLHDMKAYAQSKGITLVVKKYGMKRIEADVPEAEAG